MQRRPLHNIAQGQLPFVERPCRITVLEESCGIFADFEGSIVRGPVRRREAFTGPTSFMFHGDFGNGSNPGIFP